MPARKKHATLSGSERKAVPGAKPYGKINPNKEIRVKILLRPRLSNESSLIVKDFGAKMPKDRNYLSREELAAKFGASHEDLAKVEAFAKDHDLKIVEKSLEKRSVILSGTVAQLSSVFGVVLKSYQHPTGGIYRQRTGPIHMPPELASMVQGVFGLDNRPQARSHMRQLTKEMAAAAKAVGYTPPQVTQLYNFPPGLKGNGQSVAIIELGGGFKTQDLKAYFSGLGIPMPNIIPIFVDGAKNRPTGDLKGPDSEVMMDIEVAGAIAPNAKICVYFAPNTDPGFIDAVEAAIHDSTNKPSVISISWGGAEESWTHQTTQALDNAFQDAAMLGITVCASAGDLGSSDGLKDGLAVDFPASSQYVLGCGGTSLSSTGNKIKSETVWNDQPKGGATGGGISDIFQLPTWQGSANVQASMIPGKHVGRGVPDVAGVADPNTGYLIRVDGKQKTLGGTSAVSPLWAGLVALLNQKLSKPLGYLNPLLYGKIASSGALRDITSGNNGAYSARVGWDACCGLGTPNGAKLLEALS